MGLLDTLIAARTSQKAITGSGARAWDYGVPLGSSDSMTRRDVRAQRSFMREALGVYHTDRHIRRAEQVIAGRVGGLPWHLEDPEGHEVTDQSPDSYIAVRDLLEKPTGGVRMGSQPMTRRELWNLTIRHAGLVNVGFWFLDEIDRLTSWPKRILYVRPDRMSPGTDDKDNLTHWMLDHQEGTRKGTRLELAEVLVFYLEPPDEGFYGSGLIEAALDLARKTKLGDRHEIDVLGAGGRLAGIVSPKGENTESGVFDRLQADMRNIVDMPDAAKRTIVARAPVDFTPTAADLVELETADLARLTREEKYGLWGVSTTLAGFPAPQGLSSGDSRKYDEAATWQNACQPRVDMLFETIQFQLLDRLDRTGVDLQLVLHVPTFDDDMPKYEMAQKAREQPLSIDQRLELLGLPPVGGDLGRSIFLPDSLVSVGMTPEETNPAAKADPLPPLRRVADRLVPRLRRELAGFLSEQAREISGRVTTHGAQIARKPRDESIWWDAARWDERLEKLLAPYAQTVADLAAEKVSDALKPTGKALDDLAGVQVLNRLLQRVGLRVKGINETTRKDLAGIVRTGVEEGLSPAELGRRIQDATTFADHRAEMIARTETGTALNEAQIESFREFDVERVRVSDGDGDQACADANGAVWTLDEALIEPLAHPSCTRDFSPVIGEATG